MDQKRIVIWCNPRARSTVFELSMASVPSFKMFHEEFLLATMRGQDRMPGPFSRLSTIPGYSYKEVKERLEAEYADKEAVILKDIANVVSQFGILPDGYQHTFIVRHPRLAHRSLYKMNLELKERGLLEVDVVDFTLYLGSFQPLYNLYNHIVNEKGQKPVVIESDDLAQNPRDVLQRYCKAIGIPFYESMLNWKPGNIDFWHDSHKSPFFSFAFKSAIESSCFLPPKKAQAISASQDDDSLPQRIKELIENDTPIYEEIVKHKI